MKKMQYFSDYKKYEKYILSRKKKKYNKSNDDL